VLFAAAFVYRLRRNAEADTKRLRDYQRRLNFLTQSVGMLMESSRISVFVYDLKYRRLQTFSDGKVCDCPKNYISEFEDTLNNDDREKYRSFRDGLFSGRLNEVSFTLNRTSRITGLPFYGDYNVSVPKDENGERRYLICLEKDETEHRHMLRKQSEIITSLDLALSSANLISWKYDIAEEIYHIVDGSMNKHTLSRETWHNMMNADDLRRYTDFLRDVILDDSRPSMLKLHLQLPSDAEPMLYELTVKVRRNEQQEPIYFNGILNNVSAISGYRTRIGRLEENIKSALRAGNLAVWSYDMEERVMRIYHDYDNCDIELSAEQINDAVHPDDHSVMIAAIKNLKENDVVSDTFRLRFGKPGHWRWYECSFMLDENDKRFVTGLRRDITGMMRHMQIIAERSAELHKMNEYNEQMIEELKVAKRHAEESDRMKSAFLANMSHEIRTPLNAIVGFSELLQYSEDPSERKEYMDVINANNKLLLHLMNDVLDLSRIEAGDVKLDLETFDAALVMEEIYAMFNDSRTNTEVEFNYVSQFSTCEVTLDRSRFCQVVTNFLSNAMKFTPSGSVTMSLEESDGGVRVCVKDTGIGVDKEKQHLLFQRFEKIDSYAPGYGLGLSICKAVTEAMGGNVGFSSARGVGSTFYAWFPYNIATSIRNEDKSPCPVGEIE
jgi:signal transduction histidine kinase